MDFGFSKEQEMLKKAARQYAETRVAPKAMELDEKGAFPYEFVRQMGQMGLIGLVNSKEYADQHGAPGQDDSHRGNGACLP